MMDTKSNCPDCAHRLACASGARLACLARDAKRDDKARETEREKLKRWNELSRGKK